MPPTDRELTIPELAKRAFLTVQQRRELELSISEGRKVLEDPRLRADADEEALEKRVEREQTMLDNGSPPTYDTATKNKLMRLLKTIDEEATSTMLSNTEMERGRPGDQDKYWAWHYGPHGGDQKMLARRNILLILDPNNDEPNFLSITRLRERVDEAHRHNLPLYRERFDDIQWEEDLEDDLVRNMDPQEWQTFLELKTLDWTKPSICKELSWSTRQYEAALIKLRDSRYRAQDAEEDKIAQELTALANEGPEWTRSDRPPKAWPMNELAELQIPLGAFCKALGYSTHTFAKHVKANDWPKPMRNRVEGLLRRERLKRMPEPEAPETPSEPDMPELPETYDPVTYDPATGRETPQL